MEKKIINLHLISDSTGETLSSVARAVLSQFEKVESNDFIWSLIRTKPQLDRVLEAIAKKHNLVIVEDAAQAIDSYYKDRPLGSIGQLGAFSFHETKNIISGEGGMLCINDARYKRRAEIIREKGTNRAQFFRGEIDKYGWVDIGSSFLASEIIAAFLKAQLDEMDNIQKKRIALWNIYYDNLKNLLVKHPNLLPRIPSYATNNAHMFYLCCSSQNESRKCFHNN